MNRNLVNTQQSPTTIRILGFVLIIIGAILVGGMTAIILWVNGVINAASVSNSFRGTTEQKQIMFTVLGAVGVFGFSSILAGFWQLLTGQRNQTLVSLMIGVTFFLLILCSAGLMFF